jgi:hypothetical protein
MPLQGQFSLSLELANILPIKSALNYTVNSLIGLVRDLKRSGSDFLVEEDLVAIFGRGRIVPSFQASFREAIQVAFFMPLHPESEIILDAGPGATVRRALKDNYYMATVIQLSFLGWMHEATSLASVLVETMNRRFQSGVQDATPDPDYDGILGTLRSCVSQRSQYPWQKLVQIFEAKFENSRSWLNLQTVH